MGMRTIIGGTVGWTLKIVDITELQLLDALNLVVGNQVVDLVDTLAVAVPFGRLIRG